MKRIQVLDILDTYTSFGENEIVLIGRTPENTIETLYVLNTPQTICVAVGENFNEIDLLAQKLNEYLIATTPQCRTFQCSCNAFEFGGIIRDPCVKTIPKLQVGVVDYHIVRMRGYDIYEKDDRPFAEFTLTKSWLYNNAAKFLKSVEVGNVPPHLKGVYDKKKSGVENFILEKHLASFDWIEWNGRPKIDFKDIRILDDDNTLADFCCMGFDIEVISAKYNEIESKASLYPVGLITAQIKHKGSITKQAFCLKANPNEDLPMEQVVFFDTEREMLMAFRNFILQHNPDLIAGYYSNSYDTPYLLKRAKRLGLGEFAFFSRFPTQPVYFKESMVKTNQAGAREVTIIDCPGRVFMDLYPLVRKTYTRLDSYKLGDVSKELDLGSKEDMEYDGDDGIHAHFWGGVEKRAKLISYGIQDTELVMKMIVEMDLVRKLSAKCRILRVRARDALDRGNSYVLSMMLRAEMKGEYVLPDSNRLKLLPSLATIDGYRAIWQRAMDKKEGGDDEEGKQKIYPGGFVKDPTVGYFKCCVLTLDFNSLYPNLIRTHNICRSTHLPYPVEGCNTSPPGFAFSKEKQGVLPKLMTRLINARNQVKEKMEKEEDSSKRAMMDAEQNELKTAANSFYGLMGAMNSDICCFSAAWSVTAWGSELIKRVCSELEKKQDFVDRFGLKVVYGDTDSLFIALQKIFDETEAMKASLEIQTWINKTSGLLAGTTLKMGIENITSRFLQIAKKHYVKVIRNKKGILVLKKSGIGNRSLNKYSKQLLDLVLQMAMLQDSPPIEIERAVHQAVSRLWNHQVDRALLKHSTNLSRPIEQYKTNEAHVMVAKQMRDAGLPISVGDRVEYFYCNVSGCKNPAKYEIVVAAPLAKKLSLYAAAYVEEIQNTLEANAQLFFQGATKKERIRRLKTLCRFQNRISKTGVVNETLFIPPSKQTSLDQFLPIQPIQQATIEKKKSRKKTIQTNTLDGFYKRQREDPPPPPTEEKPLKVPKRIQTNTLDSFFIKRN